MIGTQRPLSDMWANMQFDVSSCPDNLEITLWIELGLLYRETSVLVAIPTPPRMEKLLEFRNEHKVFKER